MPKKYGISSWAPAARNLSKLKADVMDRFEGVEPGPDGLRPSEPIQADSGNYDSLLKMCKRTKCVVACAGPFADYGEGVVRACVEAGTDYVDVTGEMPWVDKMYRRYGEEAREKGVTIINCAGYDSVPPDLTTFLAAKALEKEGEQLQRFEAFVGGAGDAAPTGTFNTVAQGIDQGKRQALNIVTFGVLGAPPKPEKKTVTPKTDTQKKTSDQLTFVPKEVLSNLGTNLFWTMCPAYSSLGGQFALPHFMAPINVHAVHHTAAQEGYADLVYRERMAGLPHGPLSLYGALPVVAGLVGAVIFGVLTVLPGATTFFLKMRDMINTPGKTRNLVFNGFQPTGKTYVHGYGVSKTGRKVRVRMESLYDPGLGFTMLSACTIATQLVKRAGTPEKAKPGFNSAVSALGGEALADAFRISGAKIEVTVEGGRSKL